MSHPFCADCFKAPLHEGETTGKFEEIGGVKNYVALPSGDYPKDKALVILTDVFGLALKNTLLVADSFAKAGFPTYIPDILNGDPITPEKMGDIGTWFGSHGPAQTQPNIDKTVAGLKAQGVKDLAFTGYCFGALYTVEAAIKNTIKVGVVSHPSLLQVPDHFNKLVASSKVPLLINSCETDQQFPPEKQKIADELLGDGKYTPGYKRAYYPGATHGFGVKADLSKETEKFAKEDSFRESCEWLAKYL